MYKDDFFQKYFDKKCLNWAILSWLNGTSFNSSQAPRYKRKTLETIYPQIVLNSEIIPYYDYLFSAPFYPLCLAVSSRRIFLICWVQVFNSIMIMTAFWYFPFSAISNANFTLNLLHVLLLLIAVFLCQLQHG